MRYWLNHSCLQISFNIIVCTCDTCTFENNFENKHKFENSLQGICCIGRVYTAKATHGRHWRRSSPCSRSWGAWRVCSFHRPRGRRWRLVSWKACWWLWFAVHWQTWREDLVKRGNTQMVSIYIQVSSTSGSCQACSKWIPKKPGGPCSGIRKNLHHIKVTLAKEEL